MLFFELYIKLLLDIIIETSGFTFFIYIYIFWGGGGNMRVFFSTL